MVNWSGLTRSRAAASVDQRFGELAVLGQALSARTRLGEAPLEGRQGPLLRREGLYSSLIAAWTSQRVACSPGGSNADRALW